jgi:cell wall assembly regulator SMI1
MTRPELGCDQGRLLEVEAALGAMLPDRLRAQYRVADGRYRQDGQWWVVWPLDRLAADNPDVWKSGMLSRDLLAFGDDGTGNPFCVPLDGRDEVVRWSWIDGDAVRSEGTLAQFVAEWTNAS